MHLSLFMSFVIAFFLSSARTLSLIFSLPLSLWRRLSHRIIRHCQLSLWSRNFRWEGKGAERFQVGEVVIVRWGVLMRVGNKNMFLWEGKGKGEEDVEGNGEGSWEGRGGRRYSGRDWGWKGRRKGERKEGRLVWSISVRTARERENHQLNRIKIKVLECPCFYTTLTYTHTLYIFLSHTHTSLTHTHTHTHAYTHKHTHIYPHKHTRTHIHTDTLYIFLTHMHCHTCNTGRVYQVCWCVLTSLPEDWMFRILLMLFR